MDAPTQQQGEASRGSNISYFLFLSLLFFFMSSGPDTSSELQYRAALTRLTIERNDFKEWLYPGSTVRPNITDPNSHSTSLDTSTTSISVAPTEGLDTGRNETGDTEGERRDLVTPPRPFVLQDWTPPSTLRARVDGLLHDHGHVHEPLYYNNVSGFFKGTYTTHTDVNVTDGSQNATQLESRRGLFPWSGKSAKKGKTGRVVRLNIRETVPHVKGADVRKEKEQAEAVFIRGSLDFELHDMIDEKTGDTEEETRTTQLDMEGLHWLHNGSFFIHAAAPWHDLDMRQLPGLMFTNQTRNETGQVVLKELDARLERIKTSLATGKYGDTSESEGDTRLNCSFSMYGQLKSLPSNVPEWRLREWEKELQSPTGVTTLHLPPPTMNGIIFSKDCNLVLELDEMIGLELDEFWNKAITYSFILAALTVLQAWSLVKQMEYTSTPVSIAKVAHLTIAMQVMIDVYFCVTHLTLGVVTGNRASKAFLVPGFFGILSGLLFGLRYAAIIRVTTYRPDSPPTPPRPPTPAAASAEAVATHPTSAPAQSEPRRSVEIANATTPLLAQPATTVTEPASDESENIKQAVTIASSVIVIGLLFYYIGWFPILMVVTYSFWIPQIYHNAERGSGRNALLKKYILITACTRLFIPLYIWACPVNLLFAENSPWVFALVAWQVLQVVILFLQDTLGPRFFLPRGFWFPELDRWDYHPILPPHDVESGMVSGAEDREGARNADGDKKGEVDCVICFEKVELAQPGRERPSLDTKIGKSAGEGSAMGEVFGAARRGANRMSYMVPPCHHIAHTSCLESWAAIKMECPLCRRPLPPF